MHINDIGHNYFHNADFRVERPRGSDDYLFVLLKTPAVFTLEGREVFAEANSFVLFDKGTQQIYRANGIEFLNDWFHFDASHNEIECLRKLNIPFNRIVQLDGINELSMIIKYMCYENYSTNLHRADSTELYLKLFFNKLSEKLYCEKNGGNDSYHDKLSVIRSKIYNMPYHKWSVEKLSALASMSASRFEHVYKSIFGVSAISDVIQSRIEYSKNLLSTTDIPVIKIAEMCGYNSASHFIRQFRSRMNMTPVEYRGTTK
ncbi:MAG: helix-turn-helix transcriptional regulator [Oscillospiraceae bacterium]|nr:helix-turn-helix transcriptional regulator [Oscillospiraceae bacterium]